MERDRQSLSPPRRFTRDARALRDAWVALEQATSRAEWKAAAAEVDLRTGADQWRADDDSPHYDAALLRQELAQLQALRDAGDGLTLAEKLTETVYRHQQDISAPELYAVALSGTKHLVLRWIEQVEASLRWLARHEIPGVPRAARLERFQRAERVYGRSALMLSGGATWGFHHLGVVKALFDADLLPDILSGASTGAMVAAGVCARNDAELAEMFADTDRIRLDGLQPVGPRLALERGALLEPQALYDVLRHNVGLSTFAEARAHSGRALNIPVSPTRTRQKPRLLNHLTAPDVLIASAALASSALPGLFPPVVLQRRTRDGEIVPYVESERWVDGSLYEDLPKLRLARLHNVNHFIVSQTNPHAMPLVRHHGRRGLVPAVAGIASGTARTQGAFAADLARRVTRGGRGPVGQLADRAHALITQEYRGDIDIHPRFRPELLARMVVNPSREDLATFILEGQRATWPKLSAIRDQTRIGRTLRECVAALGPP
ncbi:MAG: DUF3336 domain-containing protein [Alphaproteobacteria bacterium]|nr:DUF3336 domain-containing protein [Alphaproteobacteria bacterium]